MPIEFCSNARDPWDFKSFRYPPDFSDLAPCDFFFFFFVRRLSGLEAHLKGVGFDCDEKIKAEVERCGLLLGTNNFIRTALKISLSVGGNAEISEFKTKSCRKIKIIQSTTRVFLLRQF